MKKTRFSEEQMVPGRTRRRGEAVLDAAGSAAWSRRRAGAACACGAREATNWSPASSRSCSWMMLSRSKVARLVSCGVRGFLDRPGRSVGDDRSHAVRVVGAQRHPACEGGFAGRDEEYW